MKEVLPHLQFAEPKPIDIVFDQDSVYLMDDWSEGDTLAQVQRKLRDAAIQEVENTCSWTRTRIGNDPESKVIIFTERKEVADMMFENIDAEDATVALFYTTGSLAVGANLQCANIVVFNDMPCSPANIQQAGGRVKRLNQKKKVHEYWMKSNADFDKNLMDILKAKIVLIMQYAEGENLQPEQIKWMYKKVSVYDIAGMEKPKKTKGKKKDERGPEYCSQNSYELPPLSP
eukprot:scaffold6655_cov169-Amphora_coffeaeformis.AAC.22